MRVGKVKKERIKNRGDKRRERHTVAVGSIAAAAVKVTIGLFAKGKLI